jgi:hypothetical protein
LSCFAVASLHQNTSGHQAATDCDARRCCWGYSHQLDLFTAVPRVRDRRPCRKTARDIAGYVHPDVRGHPQPRSPSRPQARSHPNDRTGAKRSARRYPRPGLVPPVSRCCLALAGPLPGQIRHLKGPYRYPPQPGRYGSARPRGEVARTISQPPPTGSPAAQVTGRPTRAGPGPP